MRQPTPHEELHQLLCGLFTADELKVFAGLGPHGTEVVNQVHWADLEKSAYEFIRALERHALVDHEFFVRLAEARPARRDEILAVAHRRNAPQESMAAVPARKLALPWLLVGLVAIASTVFLTSRACEAPPVIPPGFENPTVVTATPLTTAKPANQPAPVVSEDHPPPVIETVAAPDASTPAFPREIKSVCNPPSRKAILDRLRRAGEGSLRACWSEFQMQTRISPADCTLRLQWGPGGVKVTASTGHQAETRCFTKAIEPAMAPLSPCGARIDLTFSLADIEPQ